MFSAANFAFVSADCAFVDASVAAAEIASDFAVAAFAVASDLAYGFKV